MTTFGDRLRELRVKHKLSQRAIADRLGTSGEIVWGWENNAHFPSIKWLPMLCHVFKVSADYLIFGVEK